MRAFRHVVFDLDGTLVDTKDDLAEAVNVSLAALGLPRQDPRTLWGYVGRGARALIERALGDAGDPRVEAALRVFMEWYGEHLLDHARLYPGVRELVDALVAEDVACSVLTNKPSAMSHTIVARLGLGDACPRLLGGDSLPSKKPDPAGLRQLMAAAGHDEAATLLVGDSEIDVATGRNGGVTVCGVLWGFNGEAVRESRPELLAATPAEVLTLVRARASGPPAR
jgi:phosphoglycolate phosphatase